MVQELDKSINVDSLWIIPERDKSGKHANVYHGNFVPQIPNQLIRRYTKEGDCVVDMFMGSGTTLFECETLNRNFIGFDINESIIDYVKSKMVDVENIKFSISNCDVTNSTLFTESISKNLQEQKISKVDFLILHPPYMDIVKFTDKPEDFSKISNLDLFIEKFILALKNVYSFLCKGKYFAVVIGDVYKNSEVIPLGFYLMDAIKKHFNVKM